MEDVLQRRSTMQMTQAQELEEKLKRMASKGNVEHDADAESRQLQSDNRKRIATTWITIIANLKRLKKMAGEVETYRARKRVSESE